MDLASESKGVAISLTVRFLHFLRLLFLKLPFTTWRVTSPGVFMNSEMTL